MLTTDDVANIREIKEYFSKVMNIYEDAHNLGRILLEGGLISDQYILDKTNKGLRTASSMVDTYAGLNALIFKSMLLSANSTDKPDDSVAWNSAVEHSLLDLLSNKMTGVFPEISEISKQAVDYLVQLSGEISVIYGEVVENNSEILIIPKIKHQIKELNKLLKSNISIQLTIQYLKPTS